MGHRQFTHYIQMKPVLLITSDISLKFFSFSKPQYYNEDIGFEELILKCQPLHTSSFSAFIVDRNVLNTSPFLKLVEI